MTDSQDAPTETATTPGVGPFTIRELSLVGVWLVAFVVSLFPVAGPGTPSVWSGLGWILAIGVPTAAVGLVVLRRFSPEGIRRVGSLGIDQFASVAFSVAAVVWLQGVWSAIGYAAAVGGVPGGWVEWVELVLMLAGVVLTVFAPFIPVLGDDFAGRPEIPAHRNARPVLPVSPRAAGPRAPKAPKPPKPAKAPKPAREAQQQPPAYGSPAPQGWDPNAYQQGFEAHPSPQQGWDPTAWPQPGHPADTSVQAPPSGYEPVAAARAAGPSVDAPPAAAVTDPFLSLGMSSAAPAETAAPTSGAATSESAPVESTASAQQAFWALVPVERDVVDASGVPLFRIGPTAWALVIEDRGTAFVVRDEDGRTGFLLDTSGVMRG